MKNVFTFILVGLVILGCGKTNQSSFIELMEESPLTEEAEVVTETTTVIIPTHEPDEYLTPEQSLQWMKRNHFTVYKYKEYVNTYKLVRNHIYTRIIDHVGPGYTLSNPRNFTLNGQRIKVGVDSEGNIRVKK